MTHGLRTDETPFSVTHGLRTDETLFSVTHGLRTEETPFSVTHGLRSDETPISVVRELMRWPRSHKPCTRGYSQPIYVCQRANMLANGHINIFFMFTRCNQIKIIKRL